jgi:hypothetical protein
MPMVNGEKFPYTEEGKMAAKKKAKKMVMKKTAKKMAMKKMGKKK